MCSELRDKLLQLLRELCERPEEIADCIQQRADYITDLILFCRRGSCANSAFDTHLKSLLCSTSEEQLEEYLAEFQWAGVFLEKKLPARFGGKSGPDLFVEVEGIEVPVEVYTPHAALAPVHKWHDKVAEEFLRAVRSKFQYGLFPEALPGASGPPTLDPHELGVFFAQVVDGLQPRCNERLHIYRRLCQDQLHSSQACVLRVPVSGTQRPSDSIRCSLGPNLSRSVPCVLELAYDWFSCQVPKCGKLSGVSRKEAVLLREQLNGILGPRQCSRLSVYIPRASPLRSEANPADLLRQVWKAFPGWLVQRQIGLLFASGAADRRDVVFVVMPLEDDSIPGTGLWHTIRASVHQDMLTYMGNVAVYEGSTQAHVVCRTAGGGSYGVSWLSEKLEAKAKQLPESGGVLATTLRGGVHVSEIEVAAFLGRPAVVLGPEARDARPVLNVSTGSEGVFRKHDRVKAVLLWKPNPTKEPFPEVWYARSPEVGEHGLVLDHMAERLQVQKIFRWSTTGDTWDFTVAAGPGA